MPGHSYTCESNLTEDFRVLLRFRLIASFQSDRHLTPAIRHIEIPYCLGVYSIPNRVRCQTGAKVNLLSNIETKFPYKLWTVVKLMLPETSSLTRNLANFSCIRKGFNSWEPVLADW